MTRARASRLFGWSSVGLALSVLVLAFVVFYR